MKYRHYAPNIPVRVFSALEEIQNYVKCHPALRCLILQPQGIAIDHEHCAVLDAKTLYANLRLAETRGFHEILIYQDEKISLDLALSNRILRAGQLE
jgi:hypothetical protein